MLSQIKYKTEQFLLEFNRRYDGVKVMYLALLILLSTAFLLTMIDKEPKKDIAFEQMMTDLAIIENNIDKIQSNLDDIIEALEKQDANK